ncbi:hypothetical protein Pyn_10111 [Prunus yedoensis var. nudiflora]|uniref:Uncharacterized protein n=1 Tax=Prunus yedoensis var. nudiflora TaxID=2094558 RepID=A0A314XTM9_PRUYE|nr:hypothetical protein Pyn_10111 [Prunus yedoensis var. nudiflora]
MSSTRGEENLEEAGACMPRNRHSMTVSWERKCSFDKHWSKHPPRTCAERNCSSYGLVAKSMQQTNKGLSQASLFVIQVNDPLITHGEF